MSRFPVKALLTMRRRRAYALDWRWLCDIETGKGSVPFVRRVTAGLIELIEGKSVWSGVAPATKIIPRRCGPRPSDRN
jgi:hypothetical protein